MPFIFICYRRQDTGAHVRALAESLEGTLGTDQVFFDIDSIPLGANFLTGIGEAIQKSSAMLVVIGNQWLHPTNEPSRCFFDDADDTVRFEIETAIKFGIPMLPVLVEGARMPRQTALPPSLKDLSSLNAKRLRTDDWQHDFDDLVRWMNRDGHARSRGTWDTQLKLAEIIFSVGAVAAAVVSFSDQISSAFLPTDAPPPIASGFNPFVRTNFLSTLTIACSLGVASVRRGAPTEFRTLVVVGYVALLLGQLPFMNVQFSREGPSAILQVAGSLPLLGLACLATAFIRLGARPSLWVVPYALAAAWIEVMRWQKHIVGPFSGTLQSILYAVTAWAALEAWRRNKARGLGLASIGAAAWLFSQVYQTFVWLPLTVPPPAAYSWMKHLPVWTLIRNLGTWLVAMSTGDGESSSVPTVQTEKPKQELISQREG